MEMSKSADNIKVTIRIRPLSEKEKNEDSRICVRVDNNQKNTLIMEQGHDVKFFTFDSIADPKVNQSEIFEIIGRPASLSSLEGYNSSIFAYGQTGAGKTFTIMGNLQDNNYQEESRGLLPRSIEFIFSYIKEQTVEKDLEYNIKCSHLEIYNEQIIDLLNNSSGCLQMREDSKRGVYVDGLTEEPTANFKAAMDALKRGSSNRHIGATAMNIESSRSHSVFTLHIESRKTINGIVNIKFSRFNFVDLAGSERQKQTIVQSERLKEGCNINRSLHILGNVINGLVEIAEGKIRHIHYRDSKLTFLLKDSLGGNSKTSLIANINPSAAYFQETLSTIKFAKRVKLIKNNALINEESTGSLDGLKSEIKRLKEELANAGSRGMLSGLLRGDSSVGKTGGNIFILGNPGGNSEEVKEKVELKEIFQYNQKIFEMENFLKQYIDQSAITETTLQSELNIKTEYLINLTNAQELFSKAEYQYRTIIQLLRRKVERFDIIMREELAKKENFDAVLMQERDALLKENETLHQTLSHNPTLMKVFYENNQLKEDLAKYQISGKTNSFSVAEQLSKSVQLLQEISGEVKENVEERRKIAKIADKLYSCRGVSPERHERLEDSLRKMEEEIREKNEIHQIELMENERKLAELNEALEKETDKSNGLLEEMESLKEIKQKEDEEHKKRIENLIQNFEHMQKAKLDLNEMEKTMTELNIKNLELNEILQDQQAALERLTRDSEEKELVLFREKEEKAKLAQSLKENSEKYLKEKIALESQLRNAEKELRESAAENDKQQALIANANASITSLTSQKDALEHKLQNAESLRWELERNLTSAEESARAREEKLTEENKALEKGNQELNNLKANLFDELKEAKARLESINYTLEDFKLKASAKEAKFQKLEDDLKESERLKEAQANEIFELHSSLQISKEEIELFQNNMMDARRLIDSLSTDLENLRDSSANLQLANSKLEADLKESLVSIDRFHNSSEELQCELEEKVKKLQQTLEREENESAKLRTVLEKQRNESIAAKESIIKEYENKLSAIGKELDSLCETSRTERKEKDLINGKMHDLEAKANSLLQEIGNKEKAFTQEISQLKKLEKRKIDELLEKLASTEFSLNEYESKLNDSLEQISVLTNTIKDREVTLRLLEKKNKELEVTNSETCLEHEYTLKQLETTEETLKETQNQLESTEQRALRFETRLKEAHEKLGGAEVSASEVEARLMDTERMLSETEKNFKKSEEKRIEAEKSIIQKEKAMQELDNEYKGVMEKLANIEELLAEKENELSSLVEASERDLSVARASEVELNQALQENQAVLAQRTAQLKEMEMGLSKAKSDILELSEKLRVSDEAGKKLEGDIEALTQEALNQEDFLVNRAEKAENELIQKEELWRDSEIGLQKNIKELNETLREANAKSSEAEGILKEANANLSDLQNKISKLEEGLSQSRSKEEGLEIETSKLSSMMETLNRENSELKKDLKNLEKQLVDKSEKIKELEDHATNLESEKQESELARNADKEKLFEELESLKDDHKSKSLELDVLNARIKTLESEKSSVEELYRQDCGRYQTTIRDLKKKRNNDFENYERSLNELETEVVKFSSKINQQQRELENKTNEFRNMKTLSDNLERSLEVQKESNRKLKEAYEEKSRKFELLERNYLIDKQEWEVTNEGLHRIIREREELCDGLRSRMSDLEEEIEKVEEARKSFEDIEFDSRKELKVLKVEVSEIKELLKKEQEKNALLEEKLLQRTSNMGFQRENSESQSGRVDKLESIIKEQSKILDKNIKQVQEKDHEIYTLKQKLEKEIQENKNIKAQGEAVARALNEKEEATDALLKEKKTLLESLSKLEIQSREEIKRLESKHFKEIQELYDERRATLDELMLQKDDHLEEISNNYIKKFNQIQEDIKNYKVLVEQLQDKIQHLTKESENKEKQWKSRFNELEMERQQLMTELESKCTEIEMNQREFDHLKRKVKELEKEMDGKMDQLSQANKNLEISKHEIREWKSNMEIHTKQINEQKMELNAKEQKLQTLQDKAREYCRSQEREIMEIKDDYSKIEKERASLIASSVSTLEIENKHMKEELGSLRQQKDRMMEDVRSAKTAEQKLRKENQDLGDKITRLNNDKYLLLKEIDALSKSDVAESNSTEQRKIRKYDRVKEENLKLKENMETLKNENASEKEKNKLLQRRMEEYRKRLQENAALAPTHSKSQSSHEIDKFVLESGKGLSDSVTKVNMMMLNSGILTKGVLSKNSEGETLRLGVQSLISMLQEKESNFKEKEREMDSRALKFTIMEKEFMLLKQKLELLQSSHGAFRTYAEPNCSKENPEKVSGVIRRADSSDRGEGVRTQHRVSVLGENVASIRKKII